MESAQRQVPESEPQLVVLDEDGSFAARLQKQLKTQADYQIEHFTHLHADIWQAISRADLLCIASDDPESLLSQLPPRIYQPVVLLMDEDNPELISQLRERYQHLCGALPLAGHDAAKTHRHLHSFIKARPLRPAAELNLDPLTGTLNRQACYRLLLDALKRTARKTSQLALLSIDIDGFRLLNQRLGHMTGDQIVQTLAQKLRQSHAGYPLARMESDIFAILVEVTPTEHLANTAERLIQEIVLRLLTPVQIKGEELLLPCSIGVAFAPEHSAELDGLIRKAELARLRAKRMHGCSYAIFDPAKDQDLEPKISLEPELWAALRRDEFELYYQPRIDLRTGRIAGAEALIRWQHPERGLIQPAEFITQAEQTGLIVPMGYWATRQAGLDINLMQQVSRTRLSSIGVNLSFRQFQDDFLAQTIERIITQNNIDTACLEFELTESALISDEVHVRQCLEQLGKLGVSFSLDDFGTGYSSFALLQKLPIQILKIDKSFVAGVPDKEDDVEIVRAIINLAHNLNKKVIAEGVETREQLQFLKEENCDQVQGYFFSPPVPLNELLQLLKNN